MREPRASFFRTQDWPTECPICQKPSSTKKKVDPFCSVGHRDRHARETQKLYHEKFLATRAEKGDLVDNEGVVCCLSSVLATEKIVDKAHAIYRWEYIFVTVCGQEVDVPVALKGASLTCVSCISEGAKPNVI